MGILHFFGHFLHGVHFLVAFELDLHDPAKPTLAQHLQHQEMLLRQLVIALLAARLGRLLLEQHVVEEGEVFRATGLLFATGGLE